MYESLQRERAHIIIFASKVHNTKKINAMGDEGINRRHENTVEGGLCTQLAETSTVNELSEKPPSQCGTCCMKALMWTAEVTARSSRKLLWEAFGRSAPGHWKPRSRLGKNIPRLQVDAASTKTSVTSSSDGFQVYALKSRMPGRC